ncbi:MAG: 3-deoxy-manno-octulosonate cytidylyltransferase, partial [Bacteroidales bacterium]
MKIIAIIPARYQSTRFPGKPLVMIQGKSMIRRVVEQTQKAKGIAKVVVATDDSRIFDHVKSFGGNVILSKETHLNGTSRCLEALEILESSSDSPIEAVINVQGDEPGIQPEQIEQIVSLLNQPMVEIATLVKKINAQETLFNPNVVKVIFGEDHHALYFSRQAIPFLRGVEKNQWTNNHSFYKHIGMY